MDYKIMRMLCMFDLPVETEEERRAYRIFRKNLMQEGFVMMQYSVYVSVSKQGICQSVGESDKEIYTKGRKC